MSDHVGEFTTTAFADKLWLLAERLFDGREKKAAHPRLPRELASLPDHLLIDVGIDPRWVLSRDGEIISRPDLTRDGRVMPIWRSTAKS
jgi:hypothetical protein